MCIVTDRDGDTIEAEAMQSEDTVIVRITETRPPFGQMCAAVALTRAEAREFAAKLLAEIGDDDVH